MFKEEQLLALLLDHTLEPDKLNQLNEWYKFTLQCIYTVDAFELPMEISPFFNSNPYTKLQ